MLTFANTLNTATNDLTTFLSVNSFSCVNRQVQRLVAISMCLHCPRSMKVAKVFAVFLLCVYCSSLRLWLT